MAAIDTLLRAMLEKGGSDLHLTVGLPPKTRTSGSLVPLDDQFIDAIAMESLLKEICPPKRWADFLERKDLDLAHEIPGLARFRGNYLYNHWGQAAVFRQIRRPNSTAVIVSPRVMPHHMPVTPKPSLKASTQPSGIDTTQ